MSVQPLAVPTLTRALITISGKNFGENSSQLQVTVGSASCDAVNILPPTEASGLDMLTCVAPLAVTTQTVQIVRLGQPSFNTLSLYYDGASA
jgi:hypothetical protein